MGGSKDRDEMDIAVIIAGFLSGVIGAMGLGGGGVLLIYLTVFASVPQLEAQGINLLFFLPAGFTAAVIYAFKKQIEWKSVFLMWAGGAAGVVAGLLLTGVFSQKYLSLLFAAFLLIFGSVTLFSKSGKQK